jgi:hypothetical protein
MHADEKKAIFASARGRSTSNSAFNSSRSVHFSEAAEEGTGEHAGKHGHSHLSHGHTHAHGHGAGLSIAMVAEGSGAEGEEDTGEPAASALSHPSLPKTSSYFVQSRFHQLGHSRDAKRAHAEGEGDADSDENDTLAVVDHAIAVSEAVAQAAQGEPPAPPVDYRRMLPKLNSRGLPKWGNLARQLHLPLHLVKSAVRSKLGALVDLEAEDDDEGEDEEAVGLGLEEGEEGEDVDERMQGAAPHPD